MSKRVPNLICLVALGFVCVFVARGQVRQPYSAGGDGPGILPPGFAGPVAPADPPSAPTLLKAGQLPILIASSASDRFLLILRRSNGSLVDQVRTAVRHVAVLTGPLDEVLLLDVLPLDGTDVPLIGLPVTAGSSVAIRVGADAR